jgi:hypothetical protein
MSIREILTLEIILIRRGNEVCELVLTPAAGEVQQCKAAPACTASIEPVAKGSLPTSALTSAMSLSIQYNLITITSDPTCIIVCDHSAYRISCFSFLSAKKR